MSGLGGPRIGGGTTRDSAGAPGVRATGAATQAATATVGMRPAGSATGCLELSLLCFPIRSLARAISLSLCGAWAPVSRAGSGAVRTVAGASFPSRQRCRCAASTRVPTSETHSSARSKRRVRLAGWGAATARMDGIRQSVVGTESRLGTPQSIGPGSCSTFRGRHLERTDEDWRARAAF